jgi:hypothetical protein
MNDKNVKTTFSMILNERKKNRLHPECLDDIKKIYLFGKPLGYILTANLRNFVIWYLL